MLKNLSSGFVQRVVCVLATLSLVSACEKMAKERQRSQSDGYVDTDSMGAAPREMTATRIRGLKELTESSAAAMSHEQPGVLFTINDSGNDALLFALDTMGKGRGTWRVLGATNVDWESAAIGDCPVLAPASGFSSRCLLYIGDTGDNNSRHPFRVIYRVQEPIANDKRDTVRAERLTYSYADGAHDVEAMYVARNGDVFLITKRPLADKAARLRPALVYLLPKKAWSERGRATAQLIDSLPIVPGSAPLRTVTDASISPDFKHLAVRTYAQVYIFATDATTGRVDHAVAPAVCNTVPLGEAQGEGVTWVNNGGRLAFTSEGRDAPLRLATCPVP